MFRFTFLLSLFFVCIGVYLYNVNEIKIGEFSMKIPNGATPDGSDLLLDEFYGDSCPVAEKVVRTSLRSLYQANRSIAPSLVRLLFHDCFIGGCDASVLLDADRAFASEKEALPNLSLKGFDVIEVIKAKLENVCPGVVSCADILVLAATESVRVTGGPRIYVKTGRRDSATAFKEAAERELPAPQASLSVILESFASKGFSAGETVALLGAHSIGITHCTFFEDRLYNFSGTGKPDPEINPGFLQELKTKCPFSTSASSPSPSLHASHYHHKYTDSSAGHKDDRVIDLSFNNEGGDESFGTRYYRRLMQKKGVMFSDQQLMGAETERWVRLYASHPLRFRKDFVKSMKKMARYQVLTGALGQVRTTCSKVL